MIVFRCTQKLAKKFRFSLEKDIETVSENVLGDWYFNYFTFDRKYYLIGLSEKSLLSVIVAAKDFKTFPMRFIESLRIILQTIGINKSQIENEISAMENIIFTKTKSKVALGCQNDCIQMIRHRMSYQSGESLLEYSLYLGRVPFKPLKYSFATEVTKMCFDEINEKLMEKLERSTTQIDKSTD
jgi:hypothetical protein